MAVQRAWLRRSASVVALFIVAKLALLCVLLLTGGGASVLAHTSTRAIESGSSAGSGALAGAIGLVMRGALWPLALLEADARALGLWLLVEAGGAGVCLLIARSLRRDRRAVAVATGERILWAAFAGLAAYTAINVPVTRVMGTPLTYTILRTVGGALSDSIRVYFTAPNLLAAGVVLASACALPWLMGRVLSRVRPARAALTGTVLIGLLLIAGPAARSRVDLGAIPRNAAHTLLTTTLAQHLATRAPTALPPLPPVSERAGPGMSLDLSSLRRAARGRSVIWVVLESTAAQYLRPFGGAATGPDPMPSLSELAAEGVIFDAAYAAYPESIKGLYSLLCSAAPAAHTPAERYTAARIPCSPLAEQLRAVGYRTAMFHSGWFAYLGMAGVIADRGFDVLADAGAIGGDYATSFGVDEQAAVRRLLQFIDEDRSGPEARRPFFAMYLPIAGHHPYSAPGPKERPMPFGRETDYQLYLGDLRFGDQALGSLRAALKERGLDEKILWIISGDHGEAFQQHPGNFAHTLYLYDENVRVPLLIAAPGHPSFAALRSGAGQGTTPWLRAPQVASLIDVAPTVMDLIGLHPPRDWQGLSLLEPGAERASRFLTDHGLLQLGLRHGPWKFIDEVETGRGRLFDLRADPAEQHDIAAHEAERVRAYRQHLRAWSDAQRARW